jgi:hypothetical protein
LLADLLASIFFFLLRESRVIAVTQTSFAFLQVAHLYTNSLLVTLNSRDYIKAANDDLEQYSLESSTLAARRASRPISKLTVRARGSRDHFEPSHICG